MSSIARTVVDLQAAPLDTLIAGRTNLKNAVGHLRAATETVEQALATLKAGAVQPLSPAATQAIRAQLDAASSAVRSAKTEVETVSIDLTVQLSRALFRSGIMVVISPSTATLGQRATKQFLAFGDAAGGYIWSLNPATGEGTIDQTGLYTSPAQDGTVQVIATAKADSTKAGFARVTIRGDIPAAHTTRPRALRSRTE
jgi:hypothetical protein